MCGIGGILTPQGREVAVAALRRMGHCIAARGPDAEGLFTPLITSV
jgi:asparagine synthetase B (glutamine-hydrolysing)